MEIAFTKTHQGGHPEGRFLRDAFRANFDFQTSVNSLKMLLNNVVSIKCFLSRQNKNKFSQLAHQTNPGKMQSLIILD